MPDLTFPKMSRRLVLEIELPEMNVDDLPEIIRDYGNSETSVSDEILNCIGDVGNGFLIVEVSGDKDSEIVTVPAIIRSARIEEEPPTPRRQWGKNLEYLAEKIDPDGDGKLPNIWLGAAEATGDADA